MTGSPSAARDTPSLGRTNGPKPSRLLPCLLAHFALAIADVCLRTNATETQDYATRGNRVALRATPLDQSRSFRNDSGRMTTLDELDQPELSLQSWSSHEEAIER